MISVGSGAWLNSKDVPPSNVNASPGSCTTPLTNIKSNDFKSSKESSAFSKLKRLALYINGNLVLSPSWSSFIESIKSNWPKFHDEYWSLNTSVTVNSKSVRVVTPIAVTKPTGLNTSPSWNWYPVFSNTKLDTVNNVDPIPTEVFAALTPTVILAPVPVSVVDPIPLLETPVTGKFE